MTKVYMNNDKYLMSSLYHALQVLDILHEHEELGITEINRLLNFGKTSIFKILYTLEKRGYVQKLENSKYRLGMKFVNYSAKILNDLSLITIAQPIMNQLRDTYNETVNLAILSNNAQIVFIARAVSTSALTMNPTLGRIKEVHSMACGKLLLAMMNEDDLKKSLAFIKFTPFTKNTLTTKADLIKELDVIRQNGFSEDNEESEIGLYCFSAPIFNFARQCVAAISISGPTSRMCVQRNSLIPSLRTAAAEISERLGFIPD